MGTPLRPKWLWLVVRITLSISPPANTAKNHAALSITSNAQYQHITAMPLLPHTGAGSLANCQHQQTKKLCSKHHSTVWLQLDVCTVVAALQACWAAAGCIWHAALWHHLLGCQTPQAQHLHHMIISHRLVCIGMLQCQAVTLCADSHDASVVLCLDNHSQESW